MLAFYAISLLYLQGFVFITLDYNTGHLFPMKRAILFFYYLKKYIFLFLLLKVVIIMVSLKKCMSRETHIRLVF